MIFADAASKAAFMSSEIKLALCSSKDHPTPSSANPSVCTPTLKSPDRPSFIVLYAATSTRFNIEVSIDPGAKWF